MHHRRGVRLLGLKPAAGKKVKSGNTAMVQFRLKDALGYVTDGFGDAGSRPGDRRGRRQLQTRDARPATTATCSHGAPHGKYTYSLSTTGLAKGTWSLRVSVSDGTTHTTSITIH